MRYPVSCFYCEYLHPEKACRGAGGMINPSDRGERDDAKQRRPFCFFASYSKRQFELDDAVERQLTLFTPK